MSGSRSGDDPTGSGEIQQRPEPGGAADRDFHHEGVPEEGEDEAKGGPPHDDRLGGETAHTRQPPPPKE